MSSFFCESTDMVAAGSLDDGVYSSQVYHRSQSRKADRGKSADVVSVGTKPRPVGKPKSRLEDACTNAVPHVLDAATVILILPAVLLMSFYMYIKSTLLVGIPTKTCHNRVVDTISRIGMTHVPSRLRMRIGFPSHMNSIAHNSSEDYPCNVQYTVLSTMSY